MKNRRIELDLAKCLSIIFMVAVHTSGNVMDYESGTLPSLSSLIDFLGGPLAAPVFMVCMGIGMVYSRKNSPKDYAKRGVNLLVTSYVFNIVRYVIPNFLASGNLNTFWADLLLVDILQFAGLFFLVFAGFKALKLNFWQMLALAGIGVVIAEFIPKASQDSLSGLIAGHFWTGGVSAFPLLRWLPMPLAGYIFGHYLKSTERVSSFYQKVSLLGLGMIGLGLGLSLMFKIDISTYIGQEYYDLKPFQIVANVGLVMTWLGLLYGIQSLIKSEKILSLISWTSKNLNPIYLAHWIVLSYMPIVLSIFGVTVLLKSNFALVLATIIVVVLSILIVFSLEIIAKYKKSI